MMNTLRNILITLSLFCVISCETVEENPWDPSWDDKENVGDSSTDPDTPSTDPEKPVEPENAKERYVWIDAAANFNDYANDQAKIKSDMAKIKSTGFTAVIVDVRPTNSGVLFTSSVEKPLDKVDAWLKQGYTWVMRTEDFDYLQAFIDAGDEVGLKVFASINTMIGGCNCPYGRGCYGILYDDPDKRDWASVVNTKSGLINCLDFDDMTEEEASAAGLYRLNDNGQPVEDRRSGARFLNPANDEVVDYLLNLLSDLASYDLDGIILDRCRYDDTSLRSDFSDISRKKFEDYIGAKVENWPADVFEPGARNLSTPITEMQIKWMEFRAKMIHDFIEKASDRVHSVNQNIRFGAYVGAWYSSYYESGVNWASPNSTSPYLYSWATPEYNSYGYADHCDIMIIGAYAGVNSIYGSSEWTMNGFCTRAQSLFADDVPFVGGPDIGNSTGFQNGGQGAYLPSIVNVCMNACTEGMFIFDLCHIKMFNYWSDMKKAIDNYLKTL